MKRLSPWMAVAPLLIGALVWYWLWHGYASGLKTELANWVAPASSISASGFPYRLEATIDNASLDRESDALAMRLNAQTVVVDRVPWENNRQVIAGVEPRLTLLAKHLQGATLQLTAPFARASLRTQKGPVGKEGHAQSHIARLSVVWTTPTLTSGLLALPVTAAQLETHLRETPTFGNIGPSPSGPAQAEIEISGQKVQFGRSAPFTLELAAVITADGPLKSYGQWAAGGTIDIRQAILSDSSGEVARMQATIVPDGLGGLHIAGTIDSVCPQSVRAALGAQPAVSERRLRQPVRMAFAGALPGGVTASPDDLSATSRAVRGQLPPCPQFS